MTLSSEVPEHLLPRIFRRIIFIETFASFFFGADSYGSSQSPELLHMSDIDQWNLCHGIPRYPTSPAQARRRQRRHGVNFGQDRTLDPILRCSAGSYHVTYRDISCAGAGTHLLANHLAMGSAYGRSFCGFQARTERLFFFVVQEARSWGQGLCNSSVISTLQWSKVQQWSGHTPAGTITGTPTCTERTVYDRDCRWPSKQISTGRPNTRTFPNRSTRIAGSARW